MKKLIREQSVDEAKTEIVKKVIDKLTQLVQVTDNKEAYL